MKQDLALKKLKGIKPKGVKTKTESKLGRLSSLCDEVNNSFSNPGTGNPGYTHTNGYLPIFDHTKEKLSNFVFDEEDLKLFITSRLNHDQDPLLTGLYSGALLDLLTTRNRESKIETNLTIEGDNQTFDFLFAFAKHADNLTLKNLKGNFIGCKIGSYEGDANNLIAENIEGNNLFHMVGLVKGTINLVFANNIKGDDALSQVGQSTGKIGSCIGANIEGKSPMEWLAFQNGRCNFAYGENLVGESAFWNSASMAGRVKTLIGKNIERGNMLNASAENSGKIGFAYIQNFKNGYFHGPKFDDYTTHVSLMVLEDAINKWDEDISQILKGGFLGDGYPDFKDSEKIRCKKEKSPEQYQELINKYSIHKIRNIVNQMSYKDIPDLLVKAEQINNIYKSLEGVLTE
ncbi:hypothetical protein HOK51_07965 [Candidatus Woesearchaeota archaeon]|jgi:hypothetical protein|nr:hypothetical protein [Candidatus Woesearchaeota archaeon]MBT6519761.1 hypothetical protein [Candidatus Woesearchaeota archaeon]MBT7368140.1 hypothetical protein [Candidatus Woesearchaeota archaeon]